MLRRLALLLALAAAAPAAAAPAAVIETDHIRAGVVLRNAATAPGGTTDIALTHTIADGWHTYWENPGDSGEPPVLEWTMEGGTAAPLRFPAPEALPYPPLLNHGYEGAFTLLTGVTVPATWPAGLPYPVKLRVDWLVCADICIPEGGEANFTVPTAAASQPDSAVAFTFLDAERAIPPRSDVAATYTRDGNRLYLTVPMEVGADPHFFARDRDAIHHASPQEAAETFDGTGVTLALTAGRGRLDGTLSGVLTSEAGAWAITATGEPDPATVATAAPAAPEAVATPAPPPLPEVPLGRALLFAFLGGIILNLMPCVFPVLALKALGLVAHADAPAARRAAVGGAYTLGILAAFGVLAGALLALKAAGLAVGWGFQLQSPAFVAALALVIFAVGLNLSGVFAVGGGGLSRLGGAAPRDGLIGSFATGALATVVATPCTAPFMAVAVGAALAASPAVTLAIFAALGLGLATPFVALALVPGLARIMPRPGVWMERLRQALAFPLYATAAWLLWVLVQLTGSTALLGVLAAVVLVALAGWLLGLAQRGRERSHRVASGLSAVSAAAALLALWPAVTGTAPAPVSAAAAASTAEPFSPGRLEQLRAEGRPVFVNVTAAWCITCQVNEQVVFATDGFRDLIRRNDVVYLKADWTRRDPDVTRFIEAYGRGGVPLYVHFPVGGAGSVLPALLTPAAVQDAIERP